MTEETSTRRRLGSQGSAAALIGLGAVLAGAAQAAPTKDPHGYATPGQADAQAEVVLRIDGDRLYLSQGGRDLGMLTLTNTAASETLKTLLAPDKSPGSAEVRGLRPMVVADGAGGSSWLRPQAPPNAANAAGIKRAGTATEQRPGRTEDDHDAKPGGPAAAKPKASE